MGRMLLVASIATLVVGCGTSLQCGKGTVERNGECVSTTTSETNNATNNGTNNDTTGPVVTCGAGTERSGDECVVSDPATCGRGTQLDANSGECIVTDQVCGAGTAFDGAAGTCEPTSEVCADGTTYDVMLGVCMADSQCQPGDMLVGGVCLSPVEAKIENADLSEAENNNPAVGGTADEVTLPSTGFSVVLAGAIDEPTDHDGDMVNEQDIDVFTFDGTAGQIVDITLESVFGPQLKFSIDGPNGYRRESGTSFDVALDRGVVLTATGEYTLTVEPALVRGPGLPLYGGEEFGYALTFETMEIPVGQPTDLLMETTVPAAERRQPIVLTDAMNFAAGEVVPLDVRPGFDTVVMGWDGTDLTVLPSTFRPTIEVPASGELTLIFDAVVPRDDLTIQAQPGSVPTDLGAVAADATVTGTVASIDGTQPLYFIVDAPAGTILEVTQTNDEEATLDIAVGLAGPTPVRSFGSTLAFGESYGYGSRTLAGGTTLIEVASPVALVTNVELQVAAVIPGAEGVLADGATVSLSDGSQMLQGKRVFFHASTMMEMALTGQLSGAGDLDLRVLDSAGVEVFASTRDGDESFQWVAGVDDYLFEILAYSDSATGYAFDMTASTFAPTDEVEPNNDAANASSGLVAGGFVRGIAEDVANDWYEVVVTAPAVMQLGVDFDGFAASVELRNAAGESVRSAPGSFVAFVEPGTYYVVVTRDDPGAMDGEYVIGLTLAPSEADLDDVGGNDGSMVAQPAVPADQYTIAGAITASMDEDWFVFDLAAPMSFRVSAEPRATFFDASLVEIVPTNNTVDLPAGVSYVAFDSFVDGGPNDYRLMFSLLPERLESSAPAAAIPDAGWPTMVATDTVTFQGGPPCTITSVEVDVDITHTFQGDLRVTVTSPAGTTVFLYNGGGGGAQDLVETFPLTRMPFEPLDLLVGEVASGDWTLTVGDASGADLGTLNAWSVGVNCQ